jgi:hypothetical protein
LRRCDADRELPERVLDAVAGARAAGAHRPAGLPQVVDLGLLDRPLVGEIVLVEQQPNGSLPSSVSMRSRSESATSSVVRRVPSATST